MHFLLFRLYGPMASWGDIAIGERRPSAAWPTKSAVLGLIAGALGLRRVDREGHEALRDGLGFACRVDAPGHLLEDFHTAEAPSGPSLRQYAKETGAPVATRREELLALRDKDNPTLSYRQYRGDAAAVACVWRRTDSAPALETLRDALRRPVFAPSLGRRSCVPALPFAPRIDEAESAPAALRGAVLGDEQLLAPLLRAVEHVHLHWEGEGHSEGVAPLKTVRRRDVPLDRERWQFHDREEHMALIPGPARKAEG